MRKSIFWLTGWSIDPSWPPLEGWKNTLYPIDLTQASTPSEFKELAIHYLQDSPGQVVLAGWSLGAILALDIACTRPEMIERMILFSPTARFTTANNYSCAWPKRILERMQKCLKENPAGILRDFHSMMLSPLDTRAPVNPLENPFGKEQLWPVKSLIAGLEYLKNTDLREFLSNIYIPTVVINGTNDLIIPSAAGELVAESLPQATLFSIKGAGHFPFLTQKREVEKICQRFLT